MLKVVTDPPQRPRTTAAASAPKVCCGVLCGETMEREARDYGVKACIVRIIQSSHL